jgi:SAM-dependent methyltransferase
VGGLRRDFTCPLESLDVDSNEVRREWAERSGEYSPAYYAYYGPDETSESLRRTFERFLDRDAPILELGCSSGRHLAHLHDHGFENLSGIDVNADAIDVMTDAYPELAAAGTFYVDAIEDAVSDFSDGQFEAVFSVETLQHLHPDAEWVFAELSRITDDLLVTVENEGTDDRDDGDSPGVNYVRGTVPLYYRSWNRVFTDLGFREVYSQPADRDTFRAFRLSRDPADDRAR